ncbi:MAG: YlmH/Sll1252 family protein [Clostridium sp.]|nr:YlmH/Sll1252 family protein [Clostridium sp.]
MDELQILKARLLDLAEKAYKQNIYTYTGFLNAGELVVLDTLRDELNFVDYKTNGGYELAERQMVRFGSEEMFGYEEPWHISILKIEPLIDKFADELSHRDFLGAIMNLGLERTVLGDIVMKDKKRAFVICQDNMSDYLMENLIKVKHTNVRCAIAKTEQDLCELKPRLTDMQIIVSAPRFDAIIAAAIKCSRSEALSLFRSGKVTLNGRLCENNSIQLKEGDIFSVRGYGKFKYAGCGNETRKGRIYVHLMRYV